MLWGREGEVRVEGGRGGGGVKVNNSKGNVLLKGRRRKGRGGEGKEEEGKGKEEYR